MVHVAKLAPLRLGYLIADLAAALSYRIWSQKRAAAQRNYAMVLGVSPGDQRAKRLARRAFRNFGRYVIEMFRLQALSREDLRSLVVIRNTHYLHDALARNRGVIFVSGHIGNMSAASAALTLVGQRVVAAGERIRPDWMMRYMVRERAQWGITLVPVERAGLRLLQALRRKKTVVLVADVGTKRSGGVRVRFFGRETYFPAGPARLSRLSGAPLIFGCALRDQRGGYDVIIGPPVLPSVSSDERADLESMTQKVVDQLEALIRRYPDQWYMFRDMWPRVPLPIPEPVYAEPAIGSGSAAS